MKRCLAVCFIMGVGMVSSAMAWGPTKVDIYELESAALTNGCRIETDSAEASGGAYVTGFTSDQAMVSFEVDVRGPGRHNGKQWVILRFKSPDRNVPLEVELNGGGVKVVLPETSAADGWRFVRFEMRPLIWCKNIVTIKILGDEPQNIQVDYFATGPVKAPKEQFVKLQSRALAPSEIDARVAALKKRTGRDEMVVIARHFINSSHNYTYFNECFQAGGGLYLFGPAGFKTLVDSKDGEILDAELSYDGQTVLFSWRKNWQVNYDLYTIKVDGSGLRQITKHPAHDFNASWLPDGGIAFLSDRDNNYAYCMGSSSAVLYRMQPDGSNLKRLSANYLSDIAPHVMHDGKIMYCRWEYVDRFQIPSQGLWAQNPDGSGLKHVYGGRMIDPITISEAKSIPGTHKIIATLTGHGNAICGSIGVIDPSKGANNSEGCKEVLGKMVRLAGQGVRNLGQRHEFPYPVDKNYFLVSHSGSILISDYDGKDVTTLLEQGEGPTDADIGFFAALPVQSREREPLIESALDESNRDKVATLIMQDVYIGLEKQLADGTIKRGDIKQIRVAESIGKQNEATQPQAAFCWQFPVVSGGATMEPKKTVSVVEVEADGSAMFELPPMKALLFQALDKDGKVIHRMRTFTQFMGGEIQSCTGCHMDRNTAVPPNNSGRIMALQKPAQKINGAPWSEHPSAFSYQEQVQPVWDRNCVQCHNAFKRAGNLDLSGDRTDLFNVSYDNLVRTDVNSNPTASTAQGWQFKHKYISYIPSYNQAEPTYMAEKYFQPKSWGSYQSHLITVIDSGHPDASGKPRINMTDLEKRKVYAWVDYNVPYYQTSHTTYPAKMHGMRELVPDEFYQTLKDVEARRCAACHTKGEKRGGWFSWAEKDSRKINNNLEALPLSSFLRWEKPELNSFMLAPLAKKDGGTGRCGRAVFTGKDDPDYQKLLRAFDGIHEDMKRRPRMDLPGAQEVRVEGHSKLYEHCETP